MKKNEEGLMDIFADSRCLTEEEVAAYAFGKLPEAERYRLEKHVAGCPLCQDATEGAEMMGSAETFRAAAGQFNRKLAGGRGGAQVFFQQHFKAVAAAASLLLAFSAGLYFYGGDSKNENMAFSASQETSDSSGMSMDDAGNTESAPSLAEGTKEAQAPPTESGTKDRTETPSPSTTGFDASEKNNASGLNKTQATTDKEELKLEEKKESAKADLAEVVMHGVSAEEESSGKMAEESADDESDFSITESAGNTPKEDKTRAIAESKGYGKKEKTQNRKAISVLYDSLFVPQAEVLIAQGNYPEALLKLKQVVVPDNKSNYLSGWALQQQGKKNEALAFYEKTSPTVGPKEYREKALYQAALIYLEKGKKAKAEKALQEVAEMGGELKKEALRLLGR